MSLTPAQQRALTWLGIAVAIALLLWVLGPSLTPQHHADAGLHQA